MMARPYFMENKEWYKLSGTGYGWVLTDKATPKAVESYKQYIKRQKELEEIC